MTQIIIQVIKDQADEYFHTSEGDDVFQVRRYA